MSTGVYDDTSSLFLYKDNNWVAQTGEGGVLNGTTHSTSVAGAQVVFGPFTGPSIQVFSTVGTSQTEVHFTVDGVSVQDLPAESHASVQFQQQVFSMGGLNPTATHNLAINLLNAGPFTVDYVLVGDATIPTSTSTTSTSTSTASLITPIATTGTTSSTLSQSTSTASDSSTPPSSALSGPTALPASTSSGFSISTSSSAASIAIPTSGALSSGGLDATVIGSVAGAVLLFAVVVVTAVIYLRRRRLRQTTPASYSRRSPPSLGPSSKYRPSLRLNIPGTRPGVQRSSSLLPLHNNDRSATTVTPSLKAASPRTLEYPAETPASEGTVFDIKQRPISGSTMTTRVTVGTSIGQRASVPDFPNTPYPETPAPPVPELPPLAKLSEKMNLFTGMDNQNVHLQPSPAETGSSAFSKSAAGTSLFDSGSYGGAGVAGTGTNDTSLYPSPLERRGSAAPSSSGMSVVRPLPYIPTSSADGKPAPPGRRALPVAPSMYSCDPYTVVHEDAGVRLTSSGLEIPRRELPPPYRDYGV